MSNSHRQHWGSNDIEVADPYWGKWSSTINWCEQDYAVSPYITEFVNTITNAWVIVLLITLYGVYKYNLPKRLYIIYAGISCVGIGSWMFHMTLRWDWQVLGDEIPMIIAACCLLFMVLDTTPASAPAKIQWRNIGLYGGLCAGIVLFVSITYIKTGIAAFHQVSFAIIEVVAQLRVIWLLQRVVRADEPDLRLRKKRAQVVKIFLLGVAFFVLGFVLWNGDNFLCDQLTSIKRKVGRPLSFFIELHGWWHLLTGYGTILMSHAAMFLVLMLREGHQHFKMEMWGGWMPIVKRVLPEKSVSSIDEELSSFLPE